MDRCQHQPTGLRYAVELSQPKVLHPFVDMREDAVVEDQVERLVVIREWRLGRVGTEACEAEVLV